MAAVTDNFNRSNGGLGGNWTTCPSHSALTIVSNTCQASATSTFCAGLWNANTFVADHYSQIAIGTASPGSGEAVGIIVRAKAGVDEFYLGFITGDHHLIYKRQGGSYTLLLGTVTGTSTSGDVFKMDAVGSSPVVVTIYKNGVSSASYSASGADIITGGSSGILIYDTGFSLSVDNWEGGDTVATGPTTTGNFLGFM